MSRVIRDGVIAVTGGTGTIGEALVRQLLALGAAEIRVLSRGEHPSAPRVRYIRGDLADRAALRALVEGADGVFHLAAMPDVAICEQRPRDAIATNVQGSVELIDIAIGMPRPAWLVAASSVTASAPVGVYGFTKALMERAIHDANRGAARSIAVRLPGLWRGRGSVLDVWERQAAAGQPIRVTEPEMTRAAVSVDDAVHALIAAATDALDGDVWIPRCRAYRLGDLASAMTELGSIEQEFIGMRAGEKMHEDVVSQIERRYTRELPEGFLITFEQITTGVPAISSADLPRYGLDDLRGVVRRDRVHV